MANDFKGTKYEATKDIYDTSVLAKMFRADVKAAKKAGDLPKDLKLSVRTSKYSGGSSINVGVKAVNLMIINPERVRFDVENPHHVHGAPARYTPEAQNLLDTLESMLQAYNYDRSDSMTDYYCVRFAGHVDFYHELEEASRATIAEADLDELADAAREARHEAEEQEEAAQAEAQAKYEAEHAKKVGADKAILAALPQTRPEERERDDIPAEGLAIYFEWSETPYVDAAKVFPTFAEANAHLATAEVLECNELKALNREWGGYRKTKFVVSIDGDTYTGRFDIGCDEESLEAHILAFCDPAQNPFLRAGSKEDHLESKLWAAKIEKALTQEALDAFEARTVTINVPAVFFPGAAGGMA